MKSQYNDAVFQYRDEWLGFQSIGIVIPKLKIGFQEKKNGVN